MESSPPRSPTTMSPRSPLSDSPRSPRSHSSPRDVKTELCLKRTRSLSHKTDAPVELTGTIPQRQLSHPGWVRDTGYSWIVLLSAFLCYMITFGMVQSMGIYFRTYREYFNTTRKGAAILTSMLYGVFRLTGPLSMFLYKKFGSRICVITGGLLSSTAFAMSYAATSVVQLAIINVITGVGFGITTTSICAVQAEYFEKYKYFATAFVTVGASVGGFVFPALYLHLIETYAWQGSMLINAGVALQLVLLGSLLRARKRWKNVQFREVFELSLFKDPSFVILWVQCCLWGGCLNSYTSMNIDLMQSRDLPIEMARNVVMGASVVALFTRIVAALLTQAKFVRIQFMYMGAVMAWTCGMLLATFVTVPIGFVFACGLISFGYGLMIPSLGPMAIKIFGVTSFPTVMGYTAFSVGCGGLSIPFLAGMVGDAFESTVGSFYFVDMIAIMANILCAVVVIRNRRLI